MAIICDAMKLLLRQQQHHYCSVLLGTIFILTACYSGAGREDTLLARVDSLMNDRPDSALVVLATISSPRELSSAQFARYALLLTQAHDKNYITHADDSLIRVAVNYYDSIEDVGLQAKAHYYWGRVHQDRKNIAPCVREYLMAISLAEKAEERNISYLAYANLGWVYYISDFNDRADSCFQQAELLAIQCKDSARLSWVLTNRGENSITRGESFYPIAKQYLDRALMIAKITSDKDVEEIASASLSALYSRLGDGRLAVEFAKRCLTLSNNSKYYGAYLSLGDGYYKLGEYDSAKIYLQKSLLAESYDTKSGAYMRLSDIAKVEGSYEEAIEFESLLTAYQDSIKIHQQDRAVASAIKEVRIHSIEQNHRIYLSRINYLIIILLVVLILSVVFFICKRKKYLQDALAERIEHERLRVYFSAELEKKNLASDQLQQLLHLRQYEEESAELQQMHEQIRILEDEKSVILKSLLEHVEVYLKMRRIICYYKEYGDYNEDFGQDDWLHLTMSIDASGQFRANLMACNDSLLEDEIRLCYLLKIGLSIIDISIVMGCTRDNIYKKKKALFGKLAIAAEDNDLKVICDKIAPLF